MTNHIPESLITEIWQHHLTGRTDLATEEGEPIRVIYPGRVNDDRGADMRDVAIATGQGTRKGDIEFHVKASDWQAHRHHLDPAYNRVILHVVMWRDTEPTTGLQNGNKIPVLALQKYVENPPRRWHYSARSLGAFHVPCHQAVKHRLAGDIARLLDFAGKERFSAKAARFQGNLAQGAASQVLYQGIMEALGYAKNKLPFLELARRLPLQILESLVQRKLPDEECLARQQALLLGTAGLLPSQRTAWHQKDKIDDRWVEKLEKLWVSFHKTGVMSADDWHLFKVRPNNFPVRRIVAISYLALRYKEKGIFNELVNQISESAVSRGYHGLEKVLMITTNDYWASHFDFGAGIKQRIPALLGSSRAADIAANVLLPFTFAWGKLTSQPELAEKVLELYGHYPKLAANTIERHMRHQLGVSGSFVNSAQRQQGLIHIYNTLCSQGKCRGCPLGRWS